MQNKAIEKIQSKIKEKKGIIRSYDKLGLSENLKKEMVKDKEREILTLFELLNEMVKED